MLTSVHRRKVGEISGNKYVEAPSENPVRILSDISYLRALSQVMAYANEYPACIDHH